MILYNVTVSLDPKIQEDWLDWMRSTHIPDVMNTGCFLESRISRVHGEEGEVTYAISYVTESEEIYDHYQATHAVGLQKDHSDRYEGKFAAFRTKLTILEEFKK
ncbi:MAG: hypothetical protein COA38_07570 [Fluviicola sp.]|nr:MAG: hypothetical protein COA38_07570 [Fluviicola sp.]